LYIIYFYVFYIDTEELNKIQNLLIFLYRFYIDPALSLLLVILILRSVWPLLQESALILLQTVPTHIQVTFSLYNLEY